MNQEKNKNTQNQPKSNNEIESLRKALADKDKNENKLKTQLETERQEKAEIRQVLKEEEEKSLLRKHGFSVEEVENIRLMGKGEITEPLLIELKQKANQKRTNAFLSLLRDNEYQQKEKSEP